MVMDSTRKGVGGERKIFGIPILSLAVIVAIFMCVVYYASGYASENTILVEKYGIAKAKILSISRMVEKMNSKQKICQSNLEQTEQSNRDLTLQASRCKSASQEEESKRVLCQSQLSTFQQFFSSVKEKLGKEDKEVSATVATRADLDVIVDDIVKLNVKISKYENDKAKCIEVEKNFEELKKTSETMKSTMTHHDEQFKAIVDEKEKLNEELKNVRKLLEEAEEKISYFEEYEHKKGFQRKQTAEHDRNVKVEILDDKKEQSKPVEHESGVVGTSKDSLESAATKSFSNSNEVPIKPSSVNTTLNKNTTSTTPPTLARTTNTESKSNTTSPSVRPTILSTEEDDDLEGGMDESEDDERNKEDFDAEPKNNPDFVPANMK